LLRAISFPDHLKSQPVPIITNIITRGTRSMGRFALPVQIWRRTLGSFGTLFKANVVAPRNLFPDHLKSQPVPIITNIITRGTRSMGQFAHVLAHKQHREAERM